MMGGICVAGVDPNNRWVRPVPKSESSFQPSQLEQNGHVVVEPYAEVEFTVVRTLTNRPQSEDVLVSSSAGPRLIRGLSDGEVELLCDELDESSLVSSTADSTDPSGKKLEDALISQGRSIILTSVGEVQGATTHYFSGQGKYRIHFSVDGAGFNLPCTDLRWRALARESGSTDALRALSAKRLYFVLGLTRLFNDRYWPMVIGVHPLPRLAAQVDYGRL